MKIEITSASNLANVDFENLTFGSVFLLTTCLCANTKMDKWQTPEVLSLTKSLYLFRTIYECASLWHDAVFEGMKAYKDDHSVKSGFLDRIKILNASIALLRGFRFQTFPLKTFFLRA